MQAGECFFVGGYIFGLGQQMWCGTGSEELMYCDTGHGSEWIGVSMMELWNWFVKGGYVMYPILFCSVVAFAIAADRLLEYGRSSSGEVFFVRLRESLAAGRQDEVLELANGASGDAAKLTGKFLQHRDLLLLENDANLVLDGYEKNLVFLDMIVTVSPLLGLLGTILGMISSFKIFDLRAGQPFAITGGIGEALIATAFGLIVAIVALALHGVLRYRAEKLGTEIKECCNILETAKREGVL